MKRVIFILFAVGLTHCGPVVKESPVKVDRPAVLSAYRLTKPWILIDTSRKTLSLMKEDREVRIFSGIAHGSGRVGLKIREGDEVTPVGVFKIGKIYPSQKYNIFMALNYPTLAYSERALKRGQIDSSTHRRITTALEYGEMPPQHTGLGGYIGIHGLGRADPELHKLLNWTNGCIALTNRQIKELSSLVQVGTVVVIR